MYDKGGTSNYLSAVPAHIIYSSKVRTKRGISDLTLPSVPLSTRSFLINKKAACYFFTSLLITISWHLGVRMSRQFAM